MAEEVFNYSYDDKFVMEDLEQYRHLFINCDIDESVINTINYQIIRYNIIDKDIPKDKRKPIYLYINSLGGSVSDGFGVIDAIISSITPVYTINIGIAASMGFYVFIAGHKKFAMPHSEFLMHDGSMASTSSTLKAKDQIEFVSGQLEDMIMEYVGEHTKITEDVYKEKQRVEWYMLADEAKKYGVTDYIVGKDCTINDIL